MSEKTKLEIDLERAQYGEPIERKSPFNLFTIALIIMLAASVFFFYSDHKKLKVAQDEVKTITSQYDALKAQHESMKATCKGSESSDEKKAGAKAPQQKKK